MSKPRACETVQVKSLHKDLAPIGTKKWLTPEEAKFMVLVGRAQVLDDEALQQPAYNTRHMVAQMPATKKQGRKA